MNFSYLNFITIIIFSLITLNLIFETEAGIIKFKDREIKSGTELTHKIALVTKEYSLFGDDDTFYKINQTITREEKEPVNYDTSFDVLIYHSDEKTNIGDEKGEICCGESNRAYDSCRVGSTIVESDFVTVHTITFKNGNNTASFSFPTEYIVNSGVYYFQYVNCNSSNVGTVFIDGDITFQNPFGQLSAEFYPLVFFFFMLACGYILLSIFWAILSIIHRSKLLKLQHWISVVIALALVESLTWNFDLNIYNEFGHFSWTAITIGILTSTIKRTLSRLLVLVVSMGFGVVKANLGHTTIERVSILGICYLIVSGIQQLINAHSRETVNDSLRDLATLIVFPEALLDTIFYWWILLSLTRTIQQLYLRKQEVKLRMYKNFFVVLIISGVITFLIILYQTFLTVEYTSDELWDTMWLFQAFWETLYFVILVAISYIWRPTTNNSRYAYVASEDAEIMLQTMNPDDINIGDEITLDFDLGTIDSTEVRDELSKMN